MRSVQIIGVLLIAQTMAGCSRSQIAGPSPPTGPTGPATPIPSDAPKPTIYYISPGSGPSYGGDQVTIFGVIDPGATATIGGIPARLAWSATDPTKHILYSPPHAAGRVDIVVTNPDGGSRTYFGGYTYVEPGSLAQPTIVSISPDTGSIYGGGWVTVVGPTERGAIAFVGGIQVAMGWSPTDPTKHSLVTPPHAAGSVDIVVRNPDGGSQTLVGGYTYVDPGSFDLEGTWAGWTVDGADSWVEFTVREHVLTSVRCTDADERIVEISLSQPVVNGKVEFVGDAGRFSAWVASASEAAGTIDMAPCSGHPWEATHR